MKGRPLKNCHKILKLLSFDLKVCFSEASKLKDILIFHHSHTKYLCGSIYILNIV